MPSKNLGRIGKVGEWAIYHFGPPYPAGYARIKSVTLPDKYNPKGTYHLDDVPWMLEVWDARYCATFKTKEEAEKEYNDFVNNKNNYAFEG